MSTEVDHEVQVILSAKATPQGLAELARIWGELYPSMEIWGASVDPRNAEWHVSITLQSKGG
jgi:hypothetical protein